MSPDRIQNSSRPSTDGEASSQRGKKMIRLDQPSDREAVMLVAVGLAGQSEERVDESLAELAQLAETAGAEVACTSVQRRSTPCPGTLIGKGKIESVKLACEELGVETVLFDADLSPKQGSNLERLLERKVVDRTQLILDIFALHAETNEGKLQVELAQLKYTLPRLAGRGSIMRQQGGIGVRGPGEQKLEVDRRVIRNRIRRLEKDIDGIGKNRKMQRKKRLEGAVGTVALVGYTNAGKSSLLNALCGSEVLVADKLFATLDPRSRRCTLPSEREIVVTDTVGFIRALPHTLVAAFRATLEEVVDADLLLLVADASHPSMEEHIQAVHKVLDEIKVSDKAVVKVLNKMDLVAGEGPSAGISHQGLAPVAVSAHTGEGLPALLETIDKFLATRRARRKLRIPQSQAGLVEQVHRLGRVLTQSYEGEYIVLVAEIDPALEGRLAEYVAEV